MHLQVGAPPEERASDSDIEVTQPKKKYERPLPVSGWDFSMLISRSMTRAQRAYGSVGFTTELGTIFINDIKVNKDKDSDQMRTSLPFRSRANKAEGGKGRMVSIDEEMVYVVTGPKSYENIVAGPGAVKLSKLFYGAYCQCSCCNKCKDMDAKKVEDLIARYVSLNQQATEAKPLNDEIDEVNRAIDGLQKRCYSKNKVWTVEELEVATCSDFGQKELASSEEDAETTVAIVDAALAALPCPY
jgi:hypothetical protein